MPDNHAFLSPSGAKLWLQSPACWYKEAEELTDEEQAFLDNIKGENTAAEQGTLGHEIVERLLTKEYDLPLTGTKSLRLLKKSKYFSYELERYAQWAVAKTTEIIDSYDGEIKDLKFEMRVQAKTIHPELWGTSDVVIVTQDALHIVDFKFGRLPVSAKDNPQLKIYAYAAADTLGILRGIKKVRMTIIQPRNWDVDTAEIKAPALRLWGKRNVKHKAIATANKTGEMAPSLKTCRYCKHRVTDKSHRDMFLKAINYKEGGNVEDLDMREIEDIAANANTLKQWINDVVAFAQAKAYGGYPFTKVKLVRGYTRRSFKNTARVQRRLKRMGYDPKEYMKEPDIKPLTEIEALLGKTKFNDKLGNLITATENKPRLVEKESKEKPLSTAADDFGL